MLTVMAGATSIFSVKLNFLLFQALSLSWFDILLEDYKNTFSLKPKKLLQFFSKIFIVSICMTKYCKIMKADPFLYIKYLWNSTRFPCYCRYPNTKLFTRVGKKKPRYISDWQMFKTQKYFVFPKTLSIVFFSTNNVEYNKYK